MQLYVHVFNLDFHLFHCAEDTLISFNITGYMPFLLKLNAAMLRELILSPRIVCAWINLMN